MNFNQRVERVSRAMDKIGAVVCTYCGGSHGRSNLVIGEFTDCGKVVERWGDCLPIANGRCRFCGGVAQVVSMDLTEAAMAIATLKKNEFSQPVGKT